MKESLHSLVLRALDALRADGTLPAGDAPAFVVERTKNRDHGDFATNAALLLAKAAGRKPRDLEPGVIVQKLNKSLTDHAGRAKNAYPSPFHSAFKDNRAASARAMLTGEKRSVRLRTRGAAAGTYARRPATPAAPSRGESETIG